MPRCPIIGCRSGTERRNKATDKKISFFSFPKTDICKEWLKHCKNENINTKTGRVCSLHFLPSAYKEQSWTQQQLPDSFRRLPRLKEDAVPTEHLTLEISDENRKVQVQDVRDTNIELALAEETLDSRSPEESQENLNEESQKLIPLLQQIEELRKTNEQLREANKGLMQKVITTDKKLEEKDKIIKKKDKLLGKKDKKFCVQERRISKAQRNEIKYKRILQSVFTPGQLKILSSENKTKTTWCSEDIASAISLRSISPKAYRFVRNNMKIPLPAMTTLRNWARKFDVMPGILIDVLAIMKKKAASLTDLEKFTVLTFDEVYISNDVAINRKDEEVIGPHKTCQFIMARGLFGRWKQPVFYDYDKTMDKETLELVIKQLFECGFTVVAAASDLGTTNAKLWNKLNIGTGKDQHCYFKHPSNDQYRIYVFSDAPHMIKLARNHFVDHGFLYNGIHINKDLLHLLLRTTASTDLRIAHKLTQNHLDVKGPRRQNVKLAAQLFSNSIAKAIQSCAAKGLAGFENCSAVVRMLKIFNKWFDIFNSRTMYGKNPELHGFGVQLESQCQVLQEMEEFITNMTVFGKKSMLPFQKGIALCCRSLPNLFAYLKKTYGQEKIQYLMTCRLNQDGPENMFSYLRGMGGYNGHPNAIDLQNRLRWYVLGKYSTALFSVRANTVPDPLDLSLTEAQNFPSKENPSCSVSQQNEDELLINIGSLESSKDDGEKEDCEIMENETSTMTYVDDSKPMETDDY